MTPAHRAIGRCFASDYAAARIQFRSACAVGGIETKACVNPNRGPAGETLAADVAWIGPTDAPKLLVVVSGTHGAEGFCGSAAQIDWLGEGGPDRLPAGTAVLLIHTLNPWGFAWLRRVTEEGVDLNRNFVDFTEPSPENPGYDTLADAFVPQDLSERTLAEAERRIADYRARHGEAAFQLARKQGQYRHPEGIFFGGSGPTWARRTLENIIAEHRLAERESVVVLDLHSGLGSYGYGEPILKSPPGSSAAKRARQWFGESISEPALGTSSSPLVCGSASNGWLRALGGAGIFIVLEFGTYGPDSGRIALRDDHWLHAQVSIDWAAPKTHSIKARLRRHYYPDTADWKEMVLWRARMILRQALNGLAAA